MVRAAPQYLLFTESVVEPNQPAGCWRFTLQEVDGSDCLEVLESEPCLDGERLELLSVVRGLEALDQPSTVTVVTSSRYVTKGFRRGLDLWRENGWSWERFGEMRPIKNHDLWQRIDRAMQFHHIQCRCWTFQKSPELANSDDSAVMVKRIKAPKIKNNRTDELATPVSNRLFTKPTSRLMRWSSRALSRVAESTKNWAKRLDDVDFDQNQMPQAIS